MVWMLIVRFRSWDWFWRWFWLAIDDGDDNVHLGIDWVGDDVNRSHRQKTNRTLLSCLWVIMRLQCGNCLTLSAKCLKKFQLQMTRGDQIGEWCGPAPMANGIAQARNYPSKYMWIFFSRFQNKNNLIKSQNLQPHRNIHLRKTKMLRVLLHHRRSSGGWANSAETCHMPKKYLTALLILQGHSRHSYISACPGPTLHHNWLWDNLGSMKTHLGLTKAHLGWAWQWTLPGRGVCVCVSACRYVCMCVCACVCLFVFVCVCVCVYVVSWS